MYSTDFLQETASRKVHEYADGAYCVVEYVRDLSVSSTTAQTAFFMSEMNVHKKQLAVNLNGTGVVLQGGAMQWMAGNIKLGTDVKGAGDFAKKLIGSKVTGETAIKPCYQGTGIVVLEPTYKHLLVSSTEEWNGGIVLEDGMFLACDDTISMKVISRKNLSSAALGGEGLFNLSLNGFGYFALESPVPRDEIVEIKLDNDELRIDGSYAIAWSPSLKFTVEKAGKSLIGSAASGEGLVNVYRGSGTVWMAPIR